MFNGWTEFSAVWAYNPNYVIRYQNGVLTVRAKPQAVEPQAVDAGNVQPKIGQGANINTAGIVPITTAGQSLEVPRAEVLTVMDGGVNAGIGSNGEQQELIPLDFRSRINY